MQTDDTLEVKALLQSNLLVTEHGQLKVHNPIYKAVFSQKWVEEELESVNKLQPSPRDIEKNQTTDKFNIINSIPAKFYPVPIILFSLLLLVVIFTKLQEWIVCSPWIVQYDMQPENRCIQKPISVGERILIKTEEVSQENPNFREAKESGVAAMASGNYQVAVSYFEQALRHYPNAPETLIYLNNARSEATHQPTYTIAAAVPISQDLAAAQAMLRGIAQAQDQLNQAGGINGVPLKVMISDDGDNPEMAKKIASELGEKSEVLGIVGHYYSDMTLAAGKIYEKNKLATISLSTSVKISGFSDYVFRTSPSDAFTARALANYMLSEWDEKKAAVLYNSKSAYSVSLKTEFVTTVHSTGGEVVAEFDWSEPNFRTQQAFEQAIERDAQVLMLAPSTVDELQSKVLQIVRRNNEEQLKLMGGDVVYSHEILAQDVLGMVVGVFWHPDADPNSQFRRQSEQLWGADVNWITAMAYDATQAWIEALKRHPNPPTRTELQQTLSSPYFSAPGASKPIRFIQTGDRNISVQLVKVIQDDNSAVGYSFDPISTEEEE
ncbi:MAG: ABC transporter substrate-binding protein [Symploca sp. SIO2E6]|nr:ABC transporter substrate-binding protein [Symploca sp. SIO2E6]